MSDAVFALGSCRAMVPLQYLHRAGRITLANLGRHWYAHNSKDFLQRIALMQGHLQLPPEALDLVLDQDSCSAGAEALTAPMDWPDLAVFEISTRNIKRLNGHVLHSTLIAKRGVKDYEDSIDSFDALEADIRSLQAVFPRLVIGCNITLDAGLASHNIHRQKLNVFLADLATRLPGLAVVDPNSLIDMANPRAVLEDNNHFLSSATPQLAALYLKAIQGLSKPQSV